jgi:hypothetical protein
MMVYHSQNYGVFGFCSASGILETRRHLRMETDPVSETLCLLVPKIPTMGKVQKPSNSEDEGSYFEKNVVNLINDNKNF